jgi:hypothetical protein
MAGNCGPLVERYDRIKVTECEIVHDLTRHAITIYVSETEPEGSLSPYCRIRVSALNRGINLVGMLHISTHWERLLVAPGFHRSLHVCVAFSWLDLIWGLRTNGQRIPSGLEVLVFNK